MSKINLKFSLFNYETNELLNDDYKAIKQNKMISYLEKDLMVKININDNNISITRENNEYYLEMHFDLKQETILKQLFKDINYEVNLKIKTKELIIKDNYIKIIYNILDNKTVINCFKLEYEVS